MDSRPILKDIKEIRILIDSQTFDELLKQKDRVATAILRHFDSDVLDFVRTPFETSFDEFRENNPYHPIVRAHGLIEDVLSGNFDGVPKPNPVIAELVNKCTELSHKVGYALPIFR